jgi:molecular chaperone HtpG
MKPGQDAIYTITGDNAAALKASPQLEGFLAKGIEVLLLTDPIDEFWVPTIGTFEKHAFKSVGEAGADLSKINADGETKTDTAAAAESIKDVVAKLKTSLGDAVADVRASNRLTGSPVCLVADSGGMSLHFARLLSKHGEGGGVPVKRVLEVNPTHALIKRLGGLDGDAFTDAAFLLLDQARIVEGETIPDPAAFARRLSAVMEKSMGEGA